jgi:hypothetical protein
MFGEAIAGEALDGEVGFAPYVPYTPSEFRIKWTTLDWEADEA